MSPVPHPGKIRLPIPPQNACKYLPFGSHIEPALSSPIPHSRKIRLCRTRGDTGATGAKPIMALTTLLRRPGEPEVMIRMRK